MLICVPISFFLNRSLLEYNQKEKLRKCPYLFTISLLHLEMCVSWNKGKMIYAFSSRLDRKKDRGNEDEEVVSFIKVMVPVEGLFSEMHLRAF